MHTLFVITTADREDLDLMPHNVAFHECLHCLLNYIQQQSLNYMYMMKHQIL